MAEQHYPMSLPVVHAGPGSIFIPTPGAFVFYINEMNSRVVELEAENESLKQSLREETFRADANQAVVYELRDELSKCKPVGCAAKVEDEVKAIKDFQQKAISNLHDALDCIENAVGIALSDPRLKELDRRLVRLGRELKKAEGSERVIMELETENAFLHNEIDSLNSMLKGFRAAEGEFKKIKAKMLDTNRKLEVQATNLETIIQEQEEDKKKLVEALFIKAANDVMRREQEGRI